MTDTTFYFRDFNRRVKTKGQLVYRFLGPSLLDNCFLGKKESEIREARDYMGHSLYLSF